MCAFYRGMFNYLKLLTGIKRDRWVHISSIRVFKYRSVRSRYREKIRFLGPYINMSKCAERLLKVEAGRFQQLHSGEVSV